MSHWDFGRPLGGQQDTQEPAAPGYPPDEEEWAADEVAPGWPAHSPWPASPAGAAHDQPAAYDEGPAYDEGAAPGAWPADESWPAQDGWPDDDAALADPWAANRGRPAQDRWSPGGVRPDDNWADDGADNRADDGSDDRDDWDDWDDDDGTAPYPLTYERDDFVGPGPGPAGQGGPPPAEPWEPWPPAPYPDGAAPPGTRNTPASSDAPLGTGPESWLGGRDGDGTGKPARGRRGTGAAAPEWVADTEWAGAEWAEAQSGRPGQDPEDWGDPGGGPPGQSRRRWLVLAGIAAAGAALGAAAVLLTGGHPASEAAGSAKPTAPARTPGKASSPAATATPTTAAAPLTLQQAQSVLAGYTAVNNTANAAHSTSMLATIETGSSDAIDAALYQMQAAAGTAPFPAFAPAQATYYIPGGAPATGPHWFVVQVGNAFSSAPKKITSTEYLLFTQSGPGGAWQNALEPYFLAGASAPEIAVGADGLATAVSPDAATVAVAPGQLPSATAASLDGTGTGGGSGAGTSAAIADPGNLADLSDQKAWQAKLPGGQVTDTHAAASGTAGQEYALATTDGGALVFYTDAAAVTLTPPSGSALNLNVPGFYSPSQSLPGAGISFLEQFAAYDPPAGQGAPRIVADYSGITGKN
jgi:hypothetical protein